MSDLARWMATAGGDDSDAPADPMALLAGGAAHDFNNLLLVMMLNADTIGRRGREEDPQGETGEIRRAVERGRALTRQLQTFAGNDLTSPETLDPGEVLSALGPPLRDALPGGVALEMRLAEGIWPVFADRGRIGDVVTSLLGEARGRMLAGGAFTITAENRTMGDGGPVPPADYVSIRVEDDGAALPAVHLGRIFEPYYMLRQVGVGTGLGLAVCRAIVTQAGGYLSVEARARAGMRFTIYLPRLSAPAICPA